MYASVGQGYGTCGLCLKTMRFLCTLRIWSVRCAEQKLQRLLQ